MPGVPGSVVGDNLDHNEDAYSGCETPEREPDGLGEGMSTNGSTKLKRDVWQKRRFGSMRAVVSIHVQVPLPEVWL